MINARLMSIHYLKKLGYSEKEIEKYAESWNENIISYLADNSDAVYENMNYLFKDFDKDLLLKLPVFYPETFALLPEVFRKRMSLFKAEFPDEWNEIVEKQFYGYDEIPGTNYEPIMKVMGSYDDTCIAKAIEQLKNPQEIVFEFLVLLSKHIGIELSASDFYEDYLLSLEEAKFELVRNAEYLIELGLPVEIVELVITNAPYLMMLSKGEVKSRLIKGFGEDFISKMQGLDEDAIVEVLEEVGW